MARASKSNFEAATPKAMAEVLVRLATNASRLQTPGVLHSSLARPIAEKQWRTG